MASTNRREYAASTLRPHPVSAAPAAPAAAQEGAPATGAPPVVPNQLERSFHIAVGPLDGSCEHSSRSEQVRAGQSRSEQVTGGTVRVSARTIDGTQSPGVTGTMSSRVASFFWIQSMVRDDTQRTILFDRDTAIQRVSQELSHHPAGVQLTGVYHNFLRQWAEV